MLLFCSIRRGIHLRTPLNECAEWGHAFSTAGMCDCSCSLTYYHICTLRWINIYIATGFGRLTCAIVFACEWDVSDVKTWDLKPSVRFRCRVIRQMLRKASVKRRKKSCTHFNFVVFAQFKVQVKGIYDGGKQERLLPGKHSFRRHLQLMSMFLRAANASVWFSKQTTSHCTALPRRYHYETSVSVYFLLFKVLTLCVKLTSTRLALSL